MPEPVEIYYSFAGRDTKLVDRLEIHLEGLRRDGAITEIWSRRKVLAGNVTETAINEHLERARIILLLINAEFLASDLCHGELKRSLERRDDGKARVIPILLRACGISKDSPLNKLEMVPSIELVPIGSLRDKDKAFSAIADHIGRTVDEIRSKRPRGHPQQRSRLPEGPSPKFIASLCDRREQKEQLKKALAAQKTRMEKESSLVPLVCFIHGKFEEGLEDFKQRLKEHDIYELLGLERNKIPVNLVNLTWPRMESELSNPQAHFEKNLRIKALDQRPPASTQEVLKVLSQHPGPVMLCYEIINENWNAQSPSIIKALLSFWGSVAKINSATPIIVCVFFEYEQADTSSPNVHAQRNAEARDYFLALEKELSASEDSNPHLCGVVLKELGPVSRSEVIEWIDDSQAFAEFCLRHRPLFCHPDEIVRMKNAIGQLYTKVPAVGDTRKIPMNQLVASLEKMLKDYRCRT